MENVPISHHDFINDDIKAIAYLATIMPDGTPQITPVWFNVSGEFFVINSAVGRIKDRNMRACPNVAFVIADPKTAYRYIQVRGEVIEISEGGALDHIDELS